MCLETRTFLITQMRKWTCQCAYVNFGEHEISYLKADVMDKPVYTLIYKTVQVTDEVYLYCYPSDIKIFETEEAAQVKAEELNNT